MKRFQLISLIGDGYVLFEADSRAECARYARRKYGNAALLTDIRLTPVAGDGAGESDGDDESPTRRPAEHDG